MSSNLIQFPRREVAEFVCGPTWSLATALRRLGLIRIVPVSWPDGARSLGFGRFVAARPDSPTPTRTLVVETARLVGGARRTWPYGQAAEITTPSYAKAELVADAVEALANGRGLRDARQAELRALPMLERRRVIRIARRIHEAGLEWRRPDEARMLDGNRTRWRPRGKPGSAGRRVRA